MDSLAKPNKMVTGVANNDAGPLTQSDCEDRSEKDTSDDFNNLSLVTHTTQARTEPIISTCTACVWVKAKKPCVVCPRASAQGNTTQSCRSAAAWDVARSRYSPKLTLIICECKLG